MYLFPVGFQDERERLTAHAVFPSKVSPAVYGCSFLSWNFPYMGKVCKINLNYHFAKKHSAPKPDVTFKCKLCYQEFPGFYASRQHTNTQKGMQIGSGTKGMDVEHIVGDVEDHSLTEELRFCQHFFVDSELGSATPKVFYYVV